MTARSSQRARILALPRRGHVPPHAAERKEWDEGDAVLPVAPLRANSLHASERHDMNPLPSAGLLLLRVVVGVTFLMHGLDKLGDLAGAEQLFASLGIPAPGLMAPFVAVTETVGGALLIAGLATPLVGAALAIDMLVALLTAHLGHGFFARDGGFELELLLGGASLGIAFAGAGRFSLDASLQLPRRFWQRASGVIGAARWT
jgi:putative oxidoreductase